MTRRRRIARVAKALPDITELLAKHTESMHRYNPMDGGPVFRIDRDTFEAVWFATPFGQARDSDALTRSNFEVISVDLDHESPFGIGIHRFGHWAIGWYERIYVRRDDPRALIAVQKWLRALADYPVADESHWSELEWSENHPDDGQCYSNDPDCPCNDA